jgi:hypothetical protein
MAGSAVIPLFPDEPDEAPHQGDPADTGPPILTSRGQADARPRRGHGPKLGLAVRALEAQGVPVGSLRPVARDRIIEDWLKANGYAADMPSRSAIGRFMRERGGEQNG